MYALPDFSKIVLPFSADLVRGIAAPIPKGVESNLGAGKYSHVIFGMTPIQSEQMSKFFDLPPAQGLYWVVQRGADPEDICALAESQMPVRGLLDIYVLPTQGVLLLTETPGRVEYKSKQTAQIIVSASYGFETKENLNRAMAGLSNDPIGLEKIMVHALSRRGM